MSNTDRRRNERAVFWITYLVLVAGIASAVIL